MGGGRVAARRGLGAEEWLLVALYLSGGLPSCLHAEMLLFLLARHSDCFRGLHRGPREACERLAERGLVEVREGLRLTPEGERLARGCATGARLRQVGFRGVLRLPKGHRVPGE
jgi:hypothetical protein